MLNKLFQSNSSMHKRLFAQFCSPISGISQECIALLETIDFVLELKLVMLNEDGLRRQSLAYFCSFLSFLLQVGW